MKDKLSKIKPFILVLILVFLFIKLGSGGLYMYFYFIGSVLMILLLNVEAIWRDNAKLNELKKIKKGFYPGWESILYAVIAVVYGFCFLIDYRLLLNVLLMRLILVLINLNVAWMKVHRYRFVFYPDRLIYKGFRYQYKKLFNLKIEEKSISFICNNSYRQFDLGGLNENEIVEIKSIFNDFERNEYHP